MKIMSVLVFALVAMAFVAGCATGPVSTVNSTASGDSMGAASPAAGQNQIPDCRNGGWYNRAANLCVSNGP
jgi:hypothetical protein